MGFWKEYGKSQNPVNLWNILTNKKGKKLTKKQNKFIEKMNKKNFKTQQKSQKSQERLLKKFGDEAFISNPALTGHQRKYFDKLLSEARKGPAKFEQLENYEPFNDYRNVQNIEENPNYQAAQKSLQETLQGGFNAQASPMLKDYENQISGINARYNLGGQNSNAKQINFGEANAGLRERLRALEANIQQGARAEGREFAQLPLTGALAQNQQLVGQNQLGLRRDIGQNEQTLGMNRLLQSRNELTQRGGLGALGQRANDTIYRPPAFGNAINTGGYQQTSAPPSSFLENLVSNAAQGGGQAAGSAAMMAFL